MSGVPFAVTPKLPAMLTGTFPIIVTKSGLNYNISYNNTLPGSTTRRQFFEAVSTLYNMNTLYTAVNSNANDPSWIQFYTSNFIAPGDPLAVLTQATFSLSAVQMAALFNLAASLPA